MYWLEDIRVGLYGRATGDASKMAFETIPLSKISEYSADDAQYLWRLKKENRDEYNRIKLEEVPAATPHTSMIYKPRANPRLAFPYRTPVQMVDVDGTVDFDVFDALEKDPHIAGFCLSLGGDGVHVFVGIDPKPTTHREQKTCYGVVMGYLKKAYGILADDGYNGVVNDLCMVSYDPLPYWANRFLGLQWQTLLDLIPPKARKENNDPIDIIEIKKRYGFTDIDMMRDWRKVWRKLKGQNKLATRRHQAILSFSQLIIQGGVPEDQQHAVVQAFANEFITGRTVTEREIDGAIVWCRQVEHERGAPIKPVGEPDTFFILTPKGY